VPRRAKVVEWGICSAARTTQRDSRLPGLDDPRATMECYASRPKGNNRFASRARRGGSNMNLNNDVNNVLKLLLFSLCLVATAGRSTVSHAQASSAPEVPSALQVPAGQKVIWRAHASGDQIYVCRAGSDGKPQWVLKGPQAELRNDAGTAMPRGWALRQRAPTRPITTSTRPDLRRLASAPSSGQLSRRALTRAVPPGNSAAGAGGWTHSSAVAPVSTQRERSPLNRSARLWRLLISSSNRRS